MGCSNVKFIVNNIRGIKDSVKGIKIVDYLKNKVDFNGVLFLQEMHSCEKDKSGMMILKKHYSFHMEQ